MERAGIVLDAVFEFLKKILSRFLSLTLVVDFRIFMTNTHTVERTFFDSFNTDFLMYKLIF